MPPKRKSSSSNKKKSVSKKAKAVAVEEVKAIAEEVKAESSNSAELAVEIPVDEEFPVDEEEFPADEESPAVEYPVAESSSRISPRRSSEKRKAVKDDEEESRFVGEPVPDSEARERWPHRYQSKKKVVTEPANGTVPVKEYTQAKRHYTEALVDGRVRFKLGDDGYVYAGEDQEPYICRVVEMFEGVDGFPYFCAQWFYRAKDTIIQVCSNLIDDRRIFLSEIRDDNPLDCLLEKLIIVRVPLDKDQATKRTLLGNGNYYYDMSYLVPFSSYQNLPPDNEADGNESDSTISSESESNNKTVADVSKTQEGKQTEMRMLDLYSGCGAMSTGLCLGANMAELNLVTRWSVDFNKYACESLKLNHPETEVRNETAEDFLMMLREWQRLCQSFSLIEGGDLQPDNEPIDAENESTENAEEDEGDEEEALDEEVFEVEKVLGICYGDPKGIKTIGLYLKIRWKNYGPDEDTWEPIDGLTDCKEKIKEFVVNGFNSKMIPLPGDVDVICGGPPCQGISGFNRFRNSEEPLKDEKNKQLVVYMDFVEFLKPRFAIMENVVDIVKFAKGFLGRYALGRLVSMNYQARVGLMTAGSYGLPQFRMRMFMWGARPDEKLPQYPLPTHRVVSRGNSPVEFDSNAVVVDGVEEAKLEKELYLGDAISDLPPVTNAETREEIPYGEMPTTEFQRFIRRKKEDMPGFLAVCGDPSDHMLYDHLPYKCNDDDYMRLCEIPKKKGANFRDLPGVRVGADNKVEWDPAVERVYLPNGKPLVPDYAMTFVGGKSCKPFGRLWWDEIVPTVVTRAEPHNQAILHPVQDRVLTVRENARLQGFPDYYKLLGPIKEKYMQVGNAVAVPVARALGYSLAMSCKGTASEGPVYTLPRNFPILEPAVSPPVIEEDQ